jgi:hypothetical protein
MVDNVGNACVFAHSRDAFDVVRLPRRKAAGGADDGEHVVGANTRDGSSECFKVGHDVVPLHFVADNVRGAASRVNALQTRLLVNTQPQNSLATGTVRR